MGKKAGTYEADEVVAQLPHGAELLEVVALLHGRRARESVLRVVAVAPEEQRLGIEEDARAVRAQRPDAEAPRFLGGEIAAAEGEIREIEVGLRCLRARRPGLSKLPSKF